MSVQIKRIWLEKDQVTRQKWQELLISNGLLLEEQLTYCIGIFDDEALIATAGCYHNIIKGVAIDFAYQNQNLLSLLMQAMREYLTEQGISHYFLYTKPDAVAYFKESGFRLIMATDQVVFMEFGLPNFQDYLQKITTFKQATENNGAIVMNANPFTNGHLYLIETAASSCETVYVFVLSEESSFFDYQTRLDLVKKGVENLTNVVVIPTDEYLVSSATFPSYFLKNQAELVVAKEQARLDARLFKEKIAPTLAITKRFVGEEPLSRVTEVYNHAMSEVFSSSLELFVIPRKEINGEVISATKVRDLLKKNEFEQIEKLVPKTTYDYLKNK